MLENELTEPPVAATSGWVHSDAPQAVGAADLHRSGLQLWARGNIAQAASLLSKAALHSPDDYRLLTDFASVLSALGRTTEALSTLKRSLQIEPRQAQSWLMLAQLYQSIGLVADAEDAFGQALTLAPDSAPALAGLGLLLAMQRRSEDAARLLGRAIACGIDDPAVYACLAKMHYLLGRFSAACEAFGKATKAMENCKPIVRNYAEALIVEGAIAGTLDEALNSAERLLGDNAGAIDAACRQAFQMLCAYGPHDAATRIGALIQALHPEDHIIAHHMNALHGRKLEQVPESYVTTCFDAFAPKFEQHMVEVLGYRIPEKTCGLLAQERHTFDRAADLGCGTGLAAPHLKSIGVNKLIGIDVSSEMLRIARERNLYEKLVHSELHKYLVNSTESYDLIVALDVIIYFGNLTSVIAAVGSRLSSDGIFAFSYEIGAEDNYNLRASGRFTHHPEYIRRVIHPLVPLAYHKVSIRLEAGRPVPGEIVLVRKAR